VDIAERIALGFVQAERARRSRVPGAEVVDLDGLVLAFANVAEPELNTVLVERAPSDPGAAFEEAEREFTARSRAFGVDVAVGRHPAVDRCLAQMHLELILERPGMAVPISDLPDPEPPTGVRIEIVTDEADALALAGADAEAFDSDRAIDELFYAPAALGAPGGLSFVAWEGAVAVGAVAGYLHDGAVGVLGVGVVPHARRRGIGAALTLTAARAFPGADLAWLHPSEQALHMYEQLGFRAVSSWQVWVRSKPDR
jgi:ribosomal protein S18 acetylase RimI-like enzyme